MSIKNKKVFTEELLKEIFKGYEGDLYFTELRYDPVSGYLCQHSLEECKECTEFNYAPITTTIEQEDKKLDAEVDNMKKELAEQDAFDDKINTLWQKSFEDGANYQVDLTYIENYEDTKH